MAAIALLRHGTPSGQDHRIGRSRSNGSNVQDHRNTHLCGELGRKLAPEPLRVRLAAIRYLHPAADCPILNDEVCVLDTLATLTPPSRSDPLREGRRHSDAAAQAAGADT